MLRVRIPIFLSIILLQIHVIHPCVRHVGHVHQNPVSCKTPIPGQPMSLKPHLDPATPLHNSQQTSTCQWPIRRHPSCQPLLTPISSLTQLIFTKPHGHDSPYPPTGHHWPGFHQQQTLDPPPVNTTIVTSPTPTPLPPARRGSATSAIGALFSGTHLVLDHRRNPKISIARPQNYSPRPAYSPVPSSIGEPNPASAYLFPVSPDPSASVADEFPQRRVSSTMCIDITRLVELHPDPSASVPTITTAPSHATVSLFSLSSRTPPSLPMDHSLSLFF